MSNNLHGEQLDNKIHGFLERKQAERGDMAHSFGRLYQDLAKQPSRQSFGKSHKHLDASKFLDY